jgi:hypothetical protein
MFKNRKISYGSRYCQAAFVFWNLVAGFLILKLRIEDNE